jgi:hypothetical protein
LSGVQTNSLSQLNARAAIVAAAEALYRRGGPDAVTLSAVAREANFARSVVYAHFASRLDLIAMVAPPGALPEMARSVPETPQSEPHVEPYIELQEPVRLQVEPREPVLHAEPSEPVQLHAEPPAVQMHAEPPEPAQHVEALEPVQLHAEPPEPAQPQSEAENYDALMRAQADALQEISKQAIVPKPRTATDVALARLDARLSVTEKSLQALEQKMGERLKGLDVDTGALAERLHGLRQRLEKFEERQTLALAQVRLDVHNLRNGVAPAEPVLVEFLHPEPEPLVEQMADAPDADSETEPVAAEPGARVADYLVSARRAANDAAERRASLPVKRRPAWLRFLSKRRWVVLSVAAVLIGWFDVYVFAHYQPARADVPVAAASVRSAMAAQRDWSPRAQLVRGLKYMNGVGVPVDQGKARLWIERAALRGQPVAKNLMGVMYQTGSGVGMNMPVAIGWYEGAAKSGNLKAMTNLGKLYAGGWPQGTDYAKASEWFAKAAAFGDVDAAFDLAVLYERGEGVVRNVAQAYKWYAIAARQGDRNAAARAQTLATELVPEEREAADVAAMAFHPAKINAAANETPAISG